MGKEAIFQEKYDREKFSLFLKDFLINYKQEPEEIDLKEGFDKIKKLTFLGYDSRLDNLPVYEIFHQSEKDPRVTLTRESFKVMRKLGHKNSLCIFLNKDSDNYRFSLIQIDFDINKGKIETLYSNPRRFSFYLGKNAKIHTPTTYLIKKGRVKDFQNLKERFSIEVVNKEFYNEISKLFTKLVGGERIIGRNKIEEKGCLTLPEANNKLLRQEFGVRLIGRLIFCWFLVKKEIIDKELFDVDIIGNKSYYHRVIEPLFFMVLNTKEDERKLKDSFLNERLISLLDKIPFLNGGLFEPHKDDFYEQGFQSLSKYETSLKIENEWFKELFELFETYNFTVDENSTVDIELSIDPEMLGRIFENLLAEINPETSQPARKSTGSYYTPRLIVDYMVNESLKYYLINEAGIEEKKIDDLLKFENEEIVNDLNDDEKEKIIDALEKVKILDPACGSGAFPIGMLQKITLILQKIDPNSEKWLEKQLNQIKDAGIRKITKEFLVKQNPDYIRKKGILKNSIYGVDIQPIAVEISKLRCFLTLIVDQKFVENIKIEPLPNLEFKFVCANTLIGLTKVFDIQAHEIQNLIIKLKEKVSTYFYSHSVEKEKTIKEIEEIQKELFETMLIWKETRSKEYTSQLYLSNWNPFSGESSKWFEPEFMFGLNDNFDIVIGNPPYIQLQKKADKEKKIADLYKDQDYETFDREGDIYCLFYEKGINLLKKNGFLCYITSNKWMRAGYGKKLREFFIKHSPLQLIDLGPGVFENATVDTNILLIMKENVSRIRSASNTKAVTLQKEDKEDISKALKEKGVNLTKLSGDAWFIGSNEEQKLKEKIEKIGKPLKDWDVKIYYGIKTGLNDAFIIDTEKRNEILANCQDEAERERTEAIIKPILRGRDIKRYYYEWAGLWVIGTFPSLKLDIDDYPAIKKYFLDNFDIRQLEQSGLKYNHLGFNARKKTGNQWFETQDQIAYYQEFEKEKVVYIEIMTDNPEEGYDFPCYSYDENKCIVLNTAYILIGERIKYLLGLLNSKFGKFYIKQNVTQLQKRQFRMLAQYIREIFIPPITPTNEPIVNQIEALVDKILAAKKQNPHADTSEWEKEIDKLVYRLYDLTEEEVKIIEERK
uniref:site-specific DNA-methyltransferase (adenine-specific) n=1 Tax=candidate division WOR-3 bacterium TaxID=2052148 RepID=A0A7C3ND45_UNCW3